jgi:hypothetical protein
MNFSSTTTDIDMPVSDKELEFLYYSKRVYTDTLIKLHRNHKPIHPKVCINTQKDYEYYTAVMDYLYNQVEMGFTPKYLISLHYQNTSEYLKPLKETNKPYGFGDRYGFKTNRPLWHQVAWDDFIHYNRNDMDCVSVNASKIRNLILKILYGVKRLNRPDLYDIPNIFFFHEKGKVKLQYHTHILLPECSFTEEELKDLFNTTIRERCKCISRWKDIDVSPVKYDIDGVLGYCNKETRSTHSALDFSNSIPIKK